MLSPSETGTVRSVCHEWGLNPDPILAMIDAEGGTAATFIRAVKCSIPEVNRFDKAVDIACRSFVHAMSDMVTSEPDLRINAVLRLKARWAPDHVDNDPKELNQNWGRNVLARWESRDPSIKKDVRA